MTTKTLEQVLKQNHKKKNKDELVKLIQGIKGVVGSDYDKITGIQPDELSKTKNGDLLSIIEDFKENYDSKWEKSLGDAPVKVMEMIFDQMNADEAFTVQNVSDAGFAAELGSIDFEKLIGGPLNACVTAQANASVATVNFIQEVGFKSDPNDADNQILRMADFSYEKQVRNPNFGKTPGQDGVPADANVTDQFLDSEFVKLEVPFISLLSVPSLRIENCTVDFNVKLNSVYSKDVSTELKGGFTAKAGFGPIKLKVSASAKKSSSTGVKVEKQYTMGVKVVATNDEMPAGLERVLGILAE